MYNQVPANMFNRYILAAMLFICFPYAFLQPARSQSSDVKPLAGPATASPLPMAAPTPGVPVQTLDMDARSYLAAVDPAPATTSDVRSGQEEIFQALRDLAAVESPVAKALAQTLAKQLLKAQITPPQDLVNEQPRADAKPAPLAVTQQVQVTRAMLKLVSVLKVRRTGHQLPPGDDPSLASKLLVEIAQRAPTFTARLAAAAELVQSALEVDERTNPLTAAHPDQAAQAMNQCLADLLPVCGQQSDADVLAAMLTLCSSDTLDGWLRLTAITSQKINETILSDVLVQVSRAMASIKAHPSLVGMEDRLAVWEKSTQPHLRGRLTSYAKVFAEFHVMEKAIGRFFDAVNNGDKKQVANYLNPRKAARLDSAPSALALFGDGVTHIDILRIHYAGTLGPNPRLLLFIRLVGPADQKTIKTLDVTMKPLNDSFVFAE